jgi:hypothetical protein
MCGVIEDEQARFASRRAKALAMVAANEASGNRHIDNGNDHHTDCDA